MKLTLTLTDETGAVLLNETADVNDIRYAVDYNLIPVRKIGDIGYIKGYVSKVQDISVNIKKVNTKFYEEWDAILNSEEDRKSGAW